VASVSFGQRVLPLAERPGLVFRRAFAAHIVAGGDTLYRTDAAHIARRQAVFHAALTIPAGE
jgi:hypothetical protein